MATSCDVMLIDSVHRHHIFVYREVDKRNSCKVEVKNMGNRKEDGERLDLIH